MKQIAKLKDDARKHEQREEWNEAIQAYVEVLRLGEAGDGADLDLPLYNRVGDLYVRLGRAAEAVKYYEQAADKYAEAGLHNNAIALCNKALRYDAGRVELLKKLGQFSASQGFFTDARRWYLEYCERMSKRGAMDQAFEALSELANVHDDPEIRELLARQLKDHGRPEQAIREYQRAYGLRKAQGQGAEAEAIRAEIHAIDPHFDLATASMPAVHEQHPRAHEELPGFLDEPPARTYEAASPAAPPAAPPVVEAPTVVAFDGPVEETTLDLETMQIEPGPIDVDDAGTSDFGMIDLETATVGSTDFDFQPLDIGIEPSLEFSPPEPEALDEISGEPAVEPVAEDDGLFDLPTFDLDEPTVEPDEEPPLELPTFEEFQENEEAEPLPLIEENYAQQLVESEPPADDAGAPLPLSFDYADEPITQAEPEFAEPADDFSLDLDTMFSARPLTEDFSATTFELEVPEPEPEDELFAEPAPEDELFAEPVPEEESFAEPVRELEAEAVAEPVAEPPALPEYEPTPPPEPPVFQAPPAAPPAPSYPEPERMAAAPAAAPAAGRSQPEYVDLAAFLLDEEAPVESTRFVVAEHSPTGDEERDFADMLKQFKAKVAETIPKEDAGSHYDLGLAFKEMGLIDEAIAEFQTALRGGEEKLKVYEELGNCFVQKQQYSVAVTILTRAAQMPHEDESELLGVYYNLGRAHEELGQFAEARSAYERIISVDIGFMDTSERLGKL